MTLASRDLGRSGDDQGEINEVRDRPWVGYRGGAGSAAMTPRDIERQNKVFRGELRWRGDRWVESEPYDYVQREDRAKRMQHEVRLPDRTRDLPYARDVIPGIRAAEIDGRKFRDYSMNPQHPDNRGKAEGWRALGYRVDDPGARQEATNDLRDLISHYLLWNGKVDETRETAYGRNYKVLNGFIGPNDRHATLVTCWHVSDPGEQGHPRLTTAWVQPHRDEERDQ
jgi:hypothetical protein